MKTARTLDSLALVLLAVGTLCPAVCAQKSAAVPSDEQMQAEIARQEDAIKRGDGETQALLDSYREKLKVDKNDVATRFYYANALGMLGMDDDVLEQLQTVLKRDPGFVPAYHRLAVLYRNSKNFDRAIQELERALEIDPSYIAANLSLADLYIQHRSAPEKAEPLLRRILQVRPRSRTANYRLGKILYDRAAQHDGGGRAQEARKDWMDALGHFKAVVSASPDAVDNTASLNYFWLGHTYYHLGQKSESYDAFRLAARLLPPSAEKERALKNIVALAKELDRDPMWDSLHMELRRNLHHKDAEPEDDPEVRYEAARTLCEYFSFTLNREALALMVQILSEPHPDLQVRVLAARMMGVPGLAEKNPEMQQELAGVLVPVLAAPSASEDDDLIRASTAWGLNALGWRDAIPHLISALDTDSSYLFGEVLRALEALAETQSPSLAIVESGDRDELFAQRGRVSSAWSQWWENGGK